MKTKNWYKGLTATAITLAMAGAALTVPAMAIDYDLNYGDVYVGEDETGVWSGQSQDGGNTYFHYEQIGTDGQYEFISGKYQHTTDDATVHITQGTIGQEQIINEEDTNDTVDEGAVLKEVMENAQTGVAVDSTVTISNGTTGGDTDTDTGTAADGTTGTTSGGETEENTEAVDAVDVTISGVNVSTDDTFLTVGNNTNADIIRIKERLKELEAQIVKIVENA